MRVAVLHANAFDRFELPCDNEDFWAAPVKLADRSIVQVELAYDKANDLLQFRQRQPGFVFHLTGTRKGQQLSIGTPCRSLPVINFSECANPRAPGDMPSQRALGAVPR